MKVGRFGDFWSKVEKTDSCWLWRGSCADNGYGSTNYRDAQGKLRFISAHRRSYELLVGPIPEGLVLDHLCRVRSCVNPDHLEAVTVSLNLRRGHAFIRAQKALAELEQLMSQAAA